ncbi:MAG: PAS domain S-box protein [Spirochaetales bacterium]
MFPIILFDESDRNLRRLVQLLYAIVGPSFVLILVLVGREQVLWSALATGVLCLAAVAITGFSKNVGPYRWIFPGGVAPVLCCGLAAVSLGPMGWVFLAVSTAPIAWAGVLFSAPAVIGALVSGVIVCFTVLTIQGGWVFGLLSTAIYAIIQGLVAWVAFAKANSLRGARLESLARQIDEMELSMTTDGHITFANEHAAKNYGYSVDELCRMSIRDLRADPDSTEFRQQFSDVQERSVLFEAVHRRADGTTFPVEVNSRRFWSQGRTLVHSVVRDITERRAREQALRQTLEELRQNQYQLTKVIESMSEGLVAIDAQGRIVLANKSAEKTLGVPQETLLKMSVSDTDYQAVHSDGTPWPAKDQPAMLALASGLPLIDQVMGLDDPKEGRRWISVNAVPLFLHGGEQPDQVILTFVDVTERRSFTDELIKTRERYQMIFDHAASGNAIFDRECRLVVQNRVAEKRSGMAAGMNVGKSVEEMYGVERGGRLRKRIVRVLQDRVTDVLQSEYATERGPRWVESTINPVFDDDDTLAVGVHVQLRDITAERELEARVVQAQKIDSLGVLAGGIAHDFNNLLAGLSGNVELARMNLKANRVDTAIEKLDRTLPVFQRAKALSRRVLTFSKGGEPVKRVEFLGPQLERWAEFSLVGSSLKLETSIDPDLWACNCDKDQISQIIDNLVVNARQASQPGGTVRLEAGNREGNPKLIRISVIDSGAGIEPGVQAKIFDPFFTTKTSGTGLGLTTSFSIAKRHEGWIEVDSRAGQGSTFSLVLPALGDVAPEAQPVARLVEFRGSGTALVVDDQDSVREAAAEMLELLGFEVLQAADGERGLELYRQARGEGRTPVITLTDLTIPGGMGGLEMVRQLKAEGASSEFVAMSGYSSEGESPDFREVFHGRLGKPFTLREVTELLARLLPEG